LPSFSYQKNDIVKFYDIYHKDIVGEYILTESIGQNFDKRFNPYYTPKEMLELGVFEGKYLNDSIFEFPKEWFLNAMISLDKPNIQLNATKHKSRLPLKQWKDNGWINPQDPRGWFQWYCRYYLGRRTPDDHRQISRWCAFVRHAGSVRKYCEPGNITQRPAQRQALLQWSHQFDI
jgi:hypothetical protein